MSLLLTIVVLIVLLSISWAYAMHAMRQIDTQPVRPRTYARSNKRGEPEKEGADRG